MRNIALALLALLTLSACATIRQNKEFAQTWNRQYSVTVVPTKVVMKEVGVISVEEIDVDNSNVDKLIKKTLEERIVQRGYAVRPVDFDLLAQENPDIKFQVKQLHQQLILVREAMEKSNKDGIVEGSVGPVANYFSGLAGADLIAVPQYIYVQHSDSSKAFNILLNLGAGASSKAIIVLTLIDGKTGNIMWQNSAFDTMSLISQGFENRSTDVALADGIVDDLLKTLPDKTKAKAD